MWCSSYRREIRKVEREKAKVRRNYLTQRADLEKAGGSQQQLIDLEDAASDENSELSEQIRVLQTRRLEEQANRYLVPVPSDNQAWEERGRYLKPEYFTKLRNDIREEQKARREQFLAWIPLISALTGIGGVLAAILALLK